MNEYKSCLWLFLVFAILPCVYGLINSPGAQIHLSASGLNKALQSIIQVVHAAPQKINVPDFPDTKIHPGGWFPLWVHIKNVHVDGIDIDAAHSQVELLPDNTIKVFIGHAEFWANAMVRVHQSHFPPWSKTLRFKVWTTLDGAEIIVKVQNRNGQPVLTVLNSHASLDRLKITFYDDIAAAIAQAIESMFHGMIRDMAQKLINENLGRAVDGFSKAIARIPMETEIHGTMHDFHINYMLTSDPWVVGRTDFMIPIVSQFWYKNHHDDNPPTIKPSGPYPVYAASKDACLDVDSNLMFASAAYAFNVSDQSKMVIADDIFSRLKPELQHAFSCDCTGLLCFTTFFKELRQECHPGGRIKINVVAQLQAGIHFNSSGAYILAYAKSNFLAEGTGLDENPITLLEMDSDVGVHFDHNVKVEKWTIFGKADVYYTKLSAKSPYIGNISMELLDKFWNQVLKELATVITNDLLGSGIPLPPVDFATFSNSHVAFNGPFMQLCTDVQVDFSKLFPTKKTYKIGYKKRKYHKKSYTKKYVYVPIYVPIYV